MADNMEDAVCGVLREEKRAMSPEEIAERLGEKEAAVRRTLGRLASIHAVRRAGAGLFTIARGR